MEPKIESKSWNPAVEQTILKKWEDNDIYKFLLLEQKHAFVIDTPPPYPSGKWHIGAAAHYAQIHMIREKFLDLCSNALDDLEDEMIQIMKRIGLSSNFKEYYRTDSNEFRALTQSTFINLWKRGLIYLANRPNNYCPECGTTIADAEITYDDISTKLVYIDFKIKETGDNIVIASTRPELLFACQSIIVNPEDKRYMKLQGKHAIIPIFNREVKIVPHHLAKPEFGSGAVMVCSYGDQNDVQLFRELGLKEIVSLNQHGMPTTAAGPY